MRSRKHSGIREPGAHTRGHKQPKLDAATLRWLADDEMRQANYFRKSAHMSDWRSKHRDGDNIENRWYAGEAAKLALSHRNRAIRYRNLATRSGR